MGRQQCRGVAASRGAAGTQQKQTRRVIVKQAMARENAPTHLLVIHRHTLSEEFVSDGHSLVDECILREAVAIASRVVDIDQREVGRIGAEALRRVAVITAHRL